MSYTITALNAITAELGGTTTHKYNINALNEWCTLAGGTGGHRYDINAYNELDLIYGGSGGHKYVINALNSIDVALGGSGGFKYEYPALVQVGSKVNQPPIIPDGTPTSSYDVTDTGFKVVSSVDTSIETAVTLEYGLVSETYTDTVTAAESPVSSVGDVNFTLTGLEPYTDYYFRVKAVSAGGTSYSQEFVQKTDHTAEYQAVLDKATTLGYTHPGEVVKKEHNRFIKTLKDSGAWDEMDCVQFYRNDVVTTSSFGAICWKNPNAPLMQLVSSPVAVNNRGYRGDGVAAYVQTNYLPNGDGKYKLNNAGLVVLPFEIDLSLSFNPIIGNAINVNEVRLILPSGLANSYRLNSGNSFTTEVIQMTNVANLKAINRNLSTSINVFNGKTATTLTSNSTELPSNPIALLISGTSMGKHGVSAFIAGANMSDYIDAIQDAYDIYVANTL
jgi:hypothetical protein